MPVQQEIKSQLAKLLATEDIIVEHKHVQTASFNVDSRVLVLPLWEKASNDVYDMLVGHEVGHALFTPNEWDWLKEGIPAGVVNVVEDARIEKLMKRKYAGISKSFFAGYKELHNDNFFDINLDTVDQMNLADRANLHFKLGTFIHFNFTPAEQEIIDLIRNCETFKDTLSAAKALHLFCKEEIQEKQKRRNLCLKRVSTQLLSLKTLKVVGVSLLSLLTILSLPFLTLMMILMWKVGMATTLILLGWILMMISIGEDEVIVETVDALESKLQELVDADAVENSYVEVPQVDLDTVIASTEKVHNIIDQDFERQQLRRDEEIKGNGSLPPEIAKMYPELFKIVDEEFVKFKREAQKEVNYLVKEFEMKKSASAYARAATSRTGVLDTAKLHNYKFSEDLFKKITVLPDGKNHGLVFILDWSGSMNYVIQDTIKQLYNLIWFCRKVQIPFEVYAFTNEFRSRVDGIDDLDGISFL